MTDTTLREQQEVVGAVFADYDGLEVAAHYGSSAQEYDAALNSAALMDNNAAGRIWMYDKDRADLLHRLSTNDTNSLQPGQGTQTVLTNHNGRIIDLLTVHMLPDEMLVVTSPQQRAAVFNLLRKNIFFNDKVKLEHATETLSQITLYGPRSSAILSDLAEASIIDPPLDELSLFGIMTAQVGDARAWIARVPPLGGAGFALYALADDMPLVWTALVQAGAQPLGQVAFDMLRVEAGYSAYGRELSLEYIPLETGLRHAVSFTKGCYVGQEIIARMDSRKRLAKQLRGLRLSAAVEAPGKLEVAGKEAGDLTSVVQSPRFGSIGLAYVRSAHAEPGMTVGIAGSDVTGEVVALPFGE
jgi:aminomethyltransferase